MKIDLSKSVWLRIGFAFVALAFCAAPVPGDAGGCSQRAQELDVEAFFDIKQGIDCDRCRECGLSSEACDVSCARTSEASLPLGCIPLVHDAEVCLRALIAASCQEYRGHMRDVGATAPTECNFCPRDEL